VLVARGKVRQLPDSPGTGWQVNELDSLSIIFRTLEALAAASPSIIGSALIQTPLQRQPLWVYFLCPSS